jgi:hypothetical protein
VQLPVHALHRWTVSELEGYLDHLRAEREAHAGDAWRVDLSWVERQGFALHKKLLDFFDE